MATAKKPAPVRKASPQKSATPKPPAAPVKAKAPAPAKPVKAAKTAKVEKPKKAKLVRDSFTIPKPEFLVLDDLKQRAAKLGAPAKKSELLRAGIKALAGMSDAAFKAALAAVPAIKTGRPKAD